MNLRQMTAWGQNRPGETAEPIMASGIRSLTVLAEGAAMNAPAVDPVSYAEFREGVGKLALQLSDRLPEEEKYQLIREILREFETYKNASETALRERLFNWRGLTVALFTDLLDSIGTEQEKAEAVNLTREIARLTTATEVQDWQQRATSFLHPLDAEGKALGLASLKKANRSTGNDNAAGLRGGGSAIEYLRLLKQREVRGVAVLFRLGCLEMIQQRFGPEAVQDCLMSVSAFLTSALHSDDHIYHWTDSTLLGILLGRPSEQILAAELQRLANQNRETSINVAGRSIMLRIPISFETTDLNRLREPEDLYRIASQRSATW